MNRLLLPFLVLGLVLLVPAMHAQNESFEVASVKPSNPVQTGPLANLPMVLPALDRVTAQNVTLRLLVMTAYQKQPYEVIGGPQWQNSDKFDINAKAAGARSTDQLLGMLQRLLADRFKLKVHTEQREVPIYALVVARDDGRLGAKLKPSADICPDLKEMQQKALEGLAKGGGIAGLIAAGAQPNQDGPCSFSGFQPPTPGSIGLRARGQQLSTLTQLLTQFVGRPVVDKTGLTGGYDFEFAIDLRTLMRMTSDMGVNVPGLEAALAQLPEGPSLMTQLQEELGLKLDSQRGPGDVLVIDSAELPTPD
jgi:uncharacterized protein (TIGR03435 family)